MTDAVEKVTWDDKMKEVKKAFERYLYVPPDDAIAVDCVYSCYLSGVIKEMADKAWLWMVGPAGCSKTETVRPLEQHPSALFRDDLTANAFISGDALSQEEREAGGELNDPSLALELVNKTLVCKDFASLRSRSADEVGKIMALLRSAYDGEISKHSGKAGVGNRSYHVRFGLLLVTTPLPEKLRWSFQQIGERLFTYRFLRGQVSNEIVYGMVKRAVANASKDRDFRADCQHVVHEALDYVTLKANQYYPDFIISDDDALWIANLAVLACKIRTSPGEERETHGEVGTRLAKQIRQVAVCHAMWCGRNYLLWEDKLTALRLCYDSIPYGLLRLFNALFFHTVKEKSYVGIAVLADSLQMEIHALEPVLAQYAHEGLVETASATGKGSSLHSYRVTKETIVNLLDTKLLSQAYSPVMKLCEQIAKERYLN